MIVCSLSLMLDKEDGVEVKVWILIYPIVSHSKLNPAMTIWSLQASSTALMMDDIILFHAVRQTTEASCPQKSCESRIQPLRGSHWWNGDAWGRRWREPAWKCGVERHQPQR